MDEIDEKWQYIMLAVALILAMIFCCYYIICQSRWGFYTSCISTVKAGAMDENTKRAYLTFDDGPSRQTGEILDILDKNKVKATFFVIGRDESYYDMYREIVKRGHTLGLHSYSHDYRKIYSSLPDFASDIEELQNLLYDVTGTKSIYYRFPGGSSNRVSKTDMDTLIDYINKSGLVYFDWNALNGDAVKEGYTPEQLVENIKADLPGKNDVVILMHDLDARHNTVESLQMLIDYLRMEGYELLPIDENTPLVRHK